MSIPLPRVAIATSPQVSALCKKLVPNEVPSYLDIIYTPETIDNECFENVRRMINERGGSRQLGWRLWETLPGVMAEAEFHAVWVDPQGSSHDVSKRPQPNIFGILFLPDHSRIYEGKQIDNVRTALKEDPLIEDYIRAAEECFAAMNRGDLANFYGNIEQIMNSEIREAMLKQDNLLKEIAKKYY